MKIRNEEAEHSIEMQMPFIAKIMKKLVEIFNLEASFLVDPRIAIK